MVYREELAKLALEHKKWLTGRILFYATEYKFVHEDTEMHRVSQNSVSALVRRFREYLTWVSLETLLLLKVLIFPDVISAFTALYAEAIRKV